MSKQIMSGDEPEYRPALTPEGQERINIALAQELAGQHLRDGTATSQEIVYFLKLGSEKERLENEKLKSDLKLADAKIEALEAQAKASGQFEELIAILREYNGMENEEEIIDG